MRKFFFTYIMLVVLAYSCSSSINLSERKNKDLFIDNINQLKGYYHDTNNISIELLTSTSIKINYYNEKDSIISYQELQGELSKGYFKVSNSSSNLVFGPLIWTYSKSNTYLGLTNNKDLIMIQSNGGTMFFIIVPIMAANSSSVIKKYSRIDSLYHD